MTEKRMARQFCSSCRAVFRRELRFCPVDGTRLAPLGGDPLVGELLAGRYRVERVIGEGGMGRVYLARPASGDGGEYAIKVLFGELAADPRHYERFVREAARSSALEHPNVIRVLDFGSTPGSQPFVVMEYVRGSSLAAVVDAQAPLAPERIVPLLGDVCRALAHVHRHGIVHRDVKTGNILVTNRGGREMAKLFDFGVSVELASEEVRLTTKRTAIGTLTYMSPERALCQPFDHRADLFSLGVVLYQMLAGERPFEGSPMMVAIQNMTMMAPRVSVRAPGLEVDPRLERMALKLMARDPAERYQSADAVLEALSALFQ